MKSATWQIYEAAGSPEMEGGVEGVCRGCGVAATGLLFERWVKDTFTNHDQLFQGSIICHACLFCFAEQNEVLTLKVGKPKLQKCRSYSHFIVDGQWHALSKGEKIQMKELIFQSPSVAIIAESGQKHLIFRAKPGWWQFEEQGMLPCPVVLHGLLANVESLYNAGASKTEIESGHYAQRTIRNIGIQAWRQMEAEIKPHRGSLPLSLALFLAQKESDGTRTDSR